MPATVVPSPLLERRRLRVRGTVQGVGFRPFVHRHAVALGLTGWVGNDEQGVLAEVEGMPAALDALVRLVSDDPPPLADVEAVEAEPLPVTGGRGFRIAPSARHGPADVPVSADVAPCPACLAELTDPGDRRYRYPFINCTDCGPRYTIITSVPYDRPATTMAGFTMCPACRAEYDDPADRRFHAQPNACPDCGPSLAWFVAIRTDALASHGDSVRGDDALDAAVACLASGGIVAVKGVGGYHLACDAGREDVVATLRRRKARDDKPFALLVADLDAAASLCRLPPAARAALVSPRRPVVLAPRRAGAPVAGAVAPGMPDLGVLLPPSPLHVLLAGELGRPLVLTSGNRTDEPVVHDDREVAARLGPIADGVLASDRPIHVRADDSVLRVTPGGRRQVLRRARGFVPRPLRLPCPAPRPVLAVGAELKNTVAVARGATVVASHHLGDLEHWATYRAFLAAVDHLPALCGTEPAAVVHDLHPEYLSTKWALETGLPLVGVQHHHAHVAACLTEHGRTGPVLGVAFDGLGYGSDATLWGGEFLLADLMAARRVGHLRAVALPGGAAAVREPWRMAVAWLTAAAADGVVDENAITRHGRRLDPRWEAIAGLAASGRAPQTSSVGRLFDAVAALLGVHPRITYEGQAAIGLESLARSAGLAAPRTYPVAERDGVLDPAPLIGAVLADLAAGVDRARIAAGFHAGLAAATADLAIRLADAGGVDTVALTGGVFANVPLSDAVAARVTATGLEVLQHADLPPGDGSISIGQAAVAAARDAR